MSDPALRHLEYYLTRHFPQADKLETAETGCGSSTVVFSRYARHHVAYCDDAAIGSDISFVKSHPDLRSAAVSFVVGDTTKTVIASPPPTEMDILLIDGLRAFPGPDIEFFALYPHLRANGILILNSIDVPTIHNLFQFACQDDMFHLHSVVGVTAFLSRSTAPTFDVAQKDWWRQRYNCQRFPAFDWRAYSTGLSLPFSLSFEGRLASLAPYFQSGFTLVDGKPVTEGHVSRILLPFDRKIEADVEMTLDFDVIAGIERPQASLSVRVNDCHVDAVLAASGRQTVSIPLSLAGANKLDVMLVSRGLLPGHRLEAWGANPDDHRLPNVTIRSLAVREVGTTPTLIQGQCITRTDGAIVAFERAGEVFRFLVDDPNDSIQAHHYVGQLYELEELDLIARYVSRDCRVLDIGANIGNHTVWFEKVLKASRVVVIEPQPRAIALLKLNCALNELRNVDQSFLGVAFGKEATRGRIHVAERFNVAGGVIVPTATGPIDIKAGDQLLAGQEFDFIKIDVEGAELDVMLGLRTLIERCKPVIFVEIWDRHREPFFALVNEMGYACPEERRRYEMCSNALLVPKGRTSGADSSR